MMGDARDTARAVAALVAIIDTESRIEEVRLQRIGGDAFSVLVTFDTDVFKYRIVGNVHQLVSKNGVFIEDPR